MSSQSIEIQHFSKIKKFPDFSPKGLITREKARIIEFIIMCYEDMPMMNVILKRVAGGRSLWRILENYHRQAENWATSKTVCVLNGLAGCGKTTYALDYFEDKKYF